MIPDAVSKIVEGYRLVLKMTTVITVCLVVTPIQSFTGQQIHREAEDNLKHIERAAAAAAVCTTESSLSSLVPQKLDLTVAEETKQDRLSKQTWPRQKL